jgi:hypothetical protein
MLLFYSTNTMLKFRVQQLFFNERHYVWCSQYFDSAKLGRYVQGAMTPPTSDPCAIYRSIKKAINTGDQHGPKIAEQKKNLVALAAKFAKEGTITAEARNEIVGMVKKAQFLDWKPLIYVIPYALVKGREELVDVERRASGEREWIIPDLHRSEFDILEFES